MISSSFNIGFGNVDAKVVFLLFYLLISLLFSLFYGLKSTEIIVDDFRAYNKRKMKFSSWEFHLFWVNFVSSLLGWIVLFYLIVVRFGQVRNLFFIRMNLTDVTLIIISVLGITGVLGHLLSKISSVK